MGSYAKDLKTLARKYGFDIGSTKGGHFVLTRSDLDRKVFAAKTPKSPTRALANIEADLKRLIRTRGASA